MRRLVGLMCVFCYTLILPLNAQELYSLFRQRHSEFCKMVNTIVTHPPLHPYLNVGSAIWQTLPENEKNKRIAKYEATLNEVMYWEKQKKNCAPILLQ
ncbi:hypothetical protein C7477_12150 [Phyllobacterium leguminum]|uniref:Uncharacterized protein n=1 Tax=Phyllobacterium leguminum TaxID=314237 RepID=A0A318SYW8_9HYPH|nr:hypothetical protein C7477_12150 [Phyllobacterium leguminum]